MHRRALAVAAVSACCVIFLAGPAVRPSVTGDDGGSERKAAGAEFFGLTRVVGLHVEIPAEEYRAMQPPAPAGGPGGPPPAPRPRKPGERETERNHFGVEFPWARGVVTAEGDAGRGRALFAAQSCRACDTDADGQTTRGPHLVDIGKRYSPAELVESILRPSAKIAQGYEAYSFSMADGRVFTGFVVGEGGSTVQIRESSGALQDLKRSDIEKRRRQGPSAMPEGIAATLTRSQLADLVAYLQSLDAKKETRPDR